MVLIFCKAFWISYLVRKLFVVELHYYSMYQEYVNVTYFVLICCDKVQVDFNHTLQA